MAMMALNSLPVFGPVFGAGIAARVKMEVIVLTVLLDPSISQERYLCLRVSSERQYEIPATIAYQWKDAL